MTAAQQDVAGSAAPKADRSQRAVVADLLEQHGTTYAEAAGITLRDKPSPLFQLLVLAMLSSARISADVAAASARELFRAGWRTPERMRDSTWQQRVDALGRGGYRRYDESTATQLENLSVHLIAEHRGDLRRLRPNSNRGTDRLIELIGSFPRIGPIGSRIFVREVQGVWPALAPFFDDRALAGAQQLGLPQEPEALAELAPRGRVADLAAALVRTAAR